MDKIERRYVAVRARGNATQIFDRIRNAVQAEGLTRTIPVVKFERNPRREFYVFLAVENSEDLHLPNDVATVLRHAGLRRNPHWLLEPAEIQPMTGGVELETHSLIALAYKSLWTNDIGDPFDLSDASSEAEEVGDSTLEVKHNRLLYWLSATAEGTWQTFARVCNVLQLAKDGQDARSIFRRLILLGHIESSSDGQKWSICPTTLVQCAADTEVCFLAGQRTPRLIEQFNERWELDNIPQPCYHGPSCVKIHGVSPSELADNGFRLEHAGVAAVQFAQLLPDLEDWKGTLPRIDRLSTPRYNIEIWDSGQFRPCGTFYEREGQYFGESGMYRLTRDEETNPYRLVLYFDQPNQRWLRGDWYGMRFLAYDAAEQDFEVRYHLNSNDLLMPVNERWPLLYERALVLASGMLPAHAQNSRWLRYSGMPSESIELLTDKLNVSIQEI